MNCRFSTFLVFRTVMLGVLPACSADESPDPLAPGFVQIDVPAGPDSIGPNLAVGASGTVVLSWLEPDGKDHALRFSTLDDSEWLHARTVARGDNWFVNWADFPSVVPISESLWAAHWLVSQPAGGYAYDIAVALSTDNGQSWSESVTPHRDGTATEHGFVTLYPKGDGVGLVWLDGRKMLNEPGEDVAASGLTLRAAVLSPDLTLSNELLLDELTCDCCQTDVALTTDGPVAVYRDRTTSEIRDIYVSKYVGNRWKDGRPIANDNWEFPACPVNGPAIDANGQTAVVAWFTAADDVSRVRVGFSDDAALSFSIPIDVAVGETLGHVDVEMLSDRQIVVSWLRKTAIGSAEVCIRRVTVDGNLGPVHIVSAGEHVAMFSVPQMVRTGAELVLAWTVREDEVDYVRSARVPINSL
jgi:hypothetical protein